MTAVEFEALRCGDHVRRDASGDVLFVNQVRNSGYYIVTRVDPNTLARVDGLMHVLNESEGLTLLPRKASR